MSVVVVTPPSPALDLELVKRHLRLDDADQDDLVATYLAAACGHIDGPGGWLGRSVWPQTLELRRDSFVGCLRLPYGPIREVTSVMYIDGYGSEQTVAADTYALSLDGELRLAHGAYWPAPRGDANGVRIRYEAGHEELPAAIQSAVLLMVGDLFAHRETATTESSSRVQMSTTVENLLAPYRIWGA